MNPSSAMVPSRRERKKQATREQIVAAALTLFQKSGYEKTGMEQIAEAADIAKATLYHYFPVKEAILEAFIRQSFQKNNPERLKKLKKLPGTKARIEAVIRELMAGVGRQKEIFEKFLVYRVKTMISLSRENDRGNGLRELGEVIFQWGEKSGEIRAGLPREIALDWFEFAFISVARQFYLSPGDFDLEAALEPSLDLLLRGVGTNKE